MRHVRVHNSDRHMTHATDVNIAGRLSDGGGQCVKWTRQRVAGALRHASLLTARAHDGGYLPT